MKISKWIALILSAAVGLPAFAYGTDTAKVAYDASSLSVTCGYFLLRNEKNLDPDRVWTRQMEQDFTARCIEHKLKFGSLTTSSSAKLASTEDMHAYYRHCHNQLQNHPDVGTMSSTDRAAFLDDCMNNITNFGPQGAPQVMQAAEADEGDAAR